MEEFFGDEFNELMSFERDEEHLPFIDAYDPDEEYDDDFYDDIAIVKELHNLKEDTSPRLAEECE